MPAGCWLSAAFCWRPEAEPDARHCHRTGAADNRCLPACGHSACIGSTTLAGRLVRPVRRRCAVACFVPVSYLNKSSFIDSPSGSSFRTLPEGFFYAQELDACGSRSYILSHPLQLPSSGKMQVPQGMVKCLSLQGWGHFTGSSALCRRHDGKRGSRKGRHSVPFRLGGMT